MIEPVQVPQLIGVDGIAKLFDVPPNTAYSWHARGQLGPADAVVSKRSMWYRDRFVNPDKTRLDLIDKSSRPPLPVLLGPAELAAALNVQSRTIEAWRRRTRDLPATDARRPPEPVVLISKTPIWLASAWIPYAAAKSKRFNPPTSKAWHATQEAARREALEKVAP